MFINLPLEMNGIDDFEEKLSGKMLIKELRSNYHGNLGLEDIHVEIPKFKIKRSVQLKNPMTEMGIAELFTDESDVFSMLVV